jgi:hypothetical protein
MASELEVLHSQVAAMYRWWSEVAPGVTPAESGVLGELWVLIDRWEEVGDDAS